MTPASTTPVARPSPNFNDRPAGKPVSLLVLHYTGMETAAAALERLCDPEAQVSAHYTVDEDGAVYAHVAEDKRAWHAGRSFWAGETDVNGISVGVEIVNPGHEFGYRPFPGAQIDAVRALCLGILARRRIPPWRVVGHSDVAPDRKQDPGELFPWRDLAAAGVGVWPPEDGPADDLDGDPGDGDPGDGDPGNRAPIDPGRTAADLRRIGYDCPDDGPAGGLASEARRAVIAAFQRHFRPAAVTGVLDAETARRAAAVARLIPT